MNIRHYNQDEVIPKCKCVCLYISENGVRYLIVNLPSKCSILLTLHLIMGMLDTLGPTILGKPTQIISFANNIVQDHVERLMKPKEAKSKPSTSAFPDITKIVDQEELEAIEDAHDEQFSIEEYFESLILAINLLRAVMHGKESDKCCGLTFTKSSNQ